MAKGDAELPRESAMLRFMNVHSAKIDFKEYKKSNNLLNLLLIECLLVSQNQSMVVIRREALRWVGLDGTDKRPIYKLEATATSSSHPSIDRSENLLYCPLFPRSVLSESKRYCRLAIPISICGVLVSALTINVLFRR